MPSLKKIIIFCCSTVILCLTSYAQQTENDSSINNDTIIIQTLPKGIEANIKEPSVKNRNREIRDSIFAHSSDSVKRKLHSPKKAAWMSALLPGLGQIYNRKYWKLPIVYAGLAVVGYLSYDYYTRFNRYKQSYMFRTGIDPNANDYYPYILSSETLYQNWDFYRRNFEITIIAGSLFYVLNIIDAAVDAHLYRFDISDDLSLRVEPVVNTSYFMSVSGQSPGIKLSLKF